MPESSIGFEVQGKVVVEPRTVTVKGWEPKLSQGERKLKNELLESIRKGGMSPPEAPDLAAGAGPRSAVIPELLTLLRDEQKLVEISPTLYLDFDVEAELRRKVVRPPVQWLEHDDGRSPRPAEHDPKVRRAHRRIP